MSGIFTVPLSCFINITKVVVYYIKMIYDNMALFKEELDKKLVSVLEYINDYQAELNAHQGDAEERDHWGDVEIYEADIRYLEDIERYITKARSLVPKIEFTPDDWEYQQND